MARSENNLTAVFTDTANAIRSKTGASALIEPRDFADNIAIIGEGSTIATINGVEYKYCVTSEEAKAIVTQYYYDMYLPTKVRRTPAYTGDVPKTIFKDANGFQFQYGTSLENRLALDTATTGQVILNDTTYISNAYIVNDNGNWALFYNLA